MEKFIIHNRAPVLDKRGDEFSVPVYFIYKEKQNSFDMHWCQIVTKISNRQLRTAEQSLSNVGRSGNPINDVALASPGIITIVCKIEERNRLGNTSV